MKSLFVLVLINAKCPSKPIDFDYTDLVYLADFNYLLFQLIFQTHNIHMTLNIGSFTKYYI